MATAPRTFRVFVSSTFSDLKAEREALQTHVWPALAALCAEEGARFQAIDLRWGVSAEAGLDQQTMAICLGEIDRCRQVSERPNFIVLLGQRYGWRPLPTAIPKDEFDLLLGTIGDDEQRARVTEALLWSEDGPADRGTPDGPGGWYRLDANAVPPAYLLLPRAQQPAPVAATDPDLDPASSGALAALFRDLPAELPAREAAIAALAALLRDLAIELPALEAAIKALPEPLPASDRTDVIAGFEASWAAVQALYGRVRALADRLAGIPGRPGLPEREHDRLADIEEAVWRRIEAAMHGLLAALAEDAPLGRLDDKLPFHAAATEQEIWRGALRVADADAHVHCFFREIDGLPEQAPAAPERHPAREFGDYAADGSRLGAAPGLPAPAERLAYLAEQLAAKVPNNVHPISDVTWLLQSDAPTDVLKKDPPEDAPDERAKQAELRQRYTREGTLEKLADGSYSPISWRHLPDFCEQVYRSLAGTILRELAERAEIPALLAEVRDHDAFRAARVKTFLGRSDLLDEIAADIASPDVREPLLIHGRSGSGKSALVAKALTVAWQARGRPAELPPSGLKLTTGLDQVVVLARFIGVTPDSSSVRSLLQSLCLQLAVALPETNVEGEPPTEYNELVRDFHRRIEAAGPHVSAERPLLIVLDALDQLSDADGGRSLTWLRMSLPPHVHIVVSAISDPQSAASDCYRALTAWLPPSRRFEVPPLAREDADALLDAWLNDANRTLDGGRPLAEAPDGQRAQILRPESDCGLPIYLHVALQEALRWRSFDDPATIQLAPDTPGVIRGLFARLADDAQHGPLLVERSLALLAAAKNGLAEDELLALLSPRPGQSAASVGLDSEGPVPAATLERLPGDWTVLGDYFRRSPRSPRVAALPVVLWSRLALDLRPYLTERGADGASLQSYYHRQVRQVVEEDYLESSDGQDGRERHAELAAHFLGQDLEIRPTEPDSELAARLARAATELRGVVRREREAAASARGQELAEQVTPSAARGLGRANLRKLGEQPYQQTMADDWDGAFVTLSDFAFLEAKAATGEQTLTIGGTTTTLYGGPSALQEDYRLALVRWPRGAGDPGPDGSGPIVVTPTDLHDGNGYRVHCPVCNRRYELEDSWLGEVLPCPGLDNDGQPCTGRWRVNTFTVPPRPQS